MINHKALANQFISIYKNNGFIFFVIFLIKAVNNSFIKRYFRGSFSQKGEDLEIEKILGNKKKGFYVDVGAHSPDLFNNTKRFYEKGWTGINIEPNPVLFETIQKKRKKDMNLNIGIGKKGGIATFYEFESDSLSTFSEKEKKAKEKLGYKLKKEHKINVLSLKDVFKKYSRNKIDFISVDTEGLDYEVLESNDWVKYRPTLVCVETGEFGNMLNSKRSTKKEKIQKLMIENNYAEVFTNGLNTIYKNKND